LIVFISIGQAPRQNFLLKTCRKFHYKITKMYSCYTDEKYYSIWWRHWCL